MRTKPWEHHQKCNNEAAYLPAGFWKPPRAPSSALSQQGCFCIATQEAPTCCKALRVSPGFHQNWLQMQPWPSEGLWVLSWWQKPFWL